MKNKLCLIVLFFFLAGSVSAQNTFPATGSVGIGTTSPSALLTLQGSFSGMAIKGSDATWLNTNILISRNTSGDQAFRSPNIQFNDVATGTSSVIQSVQGSLQYFTYGSGGLHESMRIIGSGNVGIGVTAPVSTFQVGGFYQKTCIGDAGGTGLTNGTGYIGFNAARYNSSTWRLDGNAGADGGGIIYGDLQGNINFVPIESANGNAAALFTDAQVKSRITFQITPGGVTRAKQINIETTGWPDFVFSPSYQLKPLAEVKAYIDQHQHLPDMPAAADVEKEGINLGEMNKLLVKKIEELTLYLIEKDKQDKEKQAQIDQLKQRLDALSQEPVKH